jgi:hypothetical protein
MKRKISIEKGHNSVLMLGRLVKELPGKTEKKRNRPLTAGRKAFQNSQLIAVCPLAWPGDFTGLTGRVRAAVVLACRAKEGRRI